MKVIFGARFFISKYKEKFPSITIKLLKNTENRTLFRRKRFIVRRDISKEETNWIKKGMVFIEDEEHQMMFINEKSGEFGDVDRIIDVLEPTNLASHIYKCWEKNGGLTSTSKFWQKVGEYMGYTEVFGMPKKPNYKLEDDSEK